MTSSGRKKIQVEGKTSEDIEETKIYYLNVIRHQGNMVLDGVTTYDKAQLIESTKTYEFGSIEKDVGTANEEAKNTVVLKVEGDLIINDGVVLTSVRSSYGGPKGMVICCTGNIINNGEISMTKRGGKAEGENVYVLKNSDGSFEYIPAIGGAGATGVPSQTRRNSNPTAGYRGVNGVGRSTGGGGSGDAWNDSQHTDGGASCPAYGGTGSTGTSYCGGSGGGFGKSWHSVGGKRGGNALGNGGAGGGSWDGGSYVSVSAGNPSNGCGGLLIVNCNSYEGSGKVTSQGSIGHTIQSKCHAGSSGGGSINLFYNNSCTLNSELCNVTSVHPRGSTSGGAGGNGTVTIGKITNGQFKKIDI